MLKSAALAFLLLAPACAAAQTPHPAEQIAVAERAFAADGLALGVKPSFLKWSSPDAILLLGLMFPAQVTILPIYLGFAKVGLINKPIGLALTYLTSSFGVFLMRQFMMSQPKVLEEAALMDGTSYLNIFWRISLPQLRPALSALGIITFTQTWNYYFQAKVLLGQQNAMTLPLAMADGSPFPGRDLAIFLAAGVIIVSLVAANLGLPYLLTGLKLPPEPSFQEEEDYARIAAAEAAILAIERALRQRGEGDVDVYTDAGARIMELYRQRIDGRSKTGQEAAEARRVDTADRKLRLAGLRAERDELYRIARSNELSDETARKLVREVDLQEARIGAE